MKKILKPNHNCMDIFSVGKTGLLIDGRNYYREFYRAAQQAKYFILIAGWQFDSTVKLLRGEDVQEAGEHVEFLKFLHDLCKKNARLRIYILAWDFTMLFALNREWFQEWTFNLTANKQIHFRFDSNHSIGASHHQKFAVMDGQIGFVGGMDICSSQWDDRDHRIVNPDRTNNKGTPYEPCHDIQSFHIGPLAETLTDLFARRWKYSTGEELALAIPATPGAFEVKDGLGLPAEQVALSRTKAFTIENGDEWIREIRSLYLDAIDAVENMIYMENQYFSSQTVYKALVDRMAAPDRSRLEIILIVPRAHHSLIEDISVGMARHKMFHSLREVASQQGHNLGIYYTLARGGKEEPVPTYIHAKLLIVDDRFLTVGSANASNRSMGLDTELNVSWEVQDDGTGEKLAKAIRAARISLLQEHSGLREDPEGSSFASLDGLVNYLGSLTNNEQLRLRHFEVEKLYQNNNWLKALNPEDLAIDPDRPIVEENIYELISLDKTGTFAKGIGLLRKLLRSRPVPGTWRRSATRDNTPVSRECPSCMVRVSKFSPLFKWTVILTGILAAGAILWLR